MSPTKVPSRGRAACRLASTLLLSLLAGCGDSPSRPTPGPSASPTPFPPPPDVGLSMLHAAGTRVVNEAGETVLLRGVNLGGWLVKEGYILHLPGEALDAPSEIDRAILDLAGPDTGRQLLAEWREQWITGADLAEIRALGFNSVRLPLHHAFLWDQGRHAPRQEGFAFLDRVVSWCAQHRLWLFLDLHCAAGGQNAGNISDSDGVARLFSDAANQDATVALWEAIAAYLEYQRAWGVPLWLGETGENNHQWYTATLDLVGRKEIGWCFWPWKKVWTDNCPLSVEPPAGSWELISEYCEGRRPRPSPDVAAAAVRRNTAVIEILQAHRCPWRPRRQAGKRKGCGPPPGSSRGRTPLGGTIAGKWRPVSGAPHPGPSSPT